MVVDGCFWKVRAEVFHENNFGGVILVYNRYSEQSVCNLTKRRTLPPLFSGEIFKNGWHSPSGRFPRKHSWWNHFGKIATLNSQYVTWPKEVLYHQEFFKNGWLLTFYCAMRNVHCIPLIKIKHNFFKNTFFPSAIIEWNKLDLAIRNAESLGIFKSNILKFFRPTPRSFFNCYNHKGIRLMTRPLGEWAVYVNINSITIFKTVLILFAVVLWILNQRLTFFFTVHCLMIKQSLSWAL